MSIIDDSHDEDDVLNVREKERAGREQTNVRPILVKTSPHKLNSSQNGS